VSSLETTALIADGTLFDDHAGAVKLAFGVERRQETLDHTVGSLFDPETKTDARYSRHVGSAFSELRLPIVGDAANPREPPRLEANIAVRYDDYSDFGHTVDPEVRLRFVPVTWFKLRGSWGKSYRAPTLDNLHDYSNNASGMLVLSDPKSPTGQSTVLALQGNSPNLKEETAATWTAGIDLVPVFDPALKLSVTYYSTDYRGQIVTPAAADPFAVLVQENQWAPIITRNPTQAQVDAVCSRADFFMSRPACLNSSPAAIVDFRLANLAVTNTKGIDIDAHQAVDSGAGRVDFGVIGNYTFHFDQAVSGTSPGLDILNSFNNPLRLHLRGTAGWTEYRVGDVGMGANVAVNFTNGYQNPGSSLLPHVRSLTTLDLQLRYRTQDNRAEIALNAVNICNQSPPFADYFVGYDRVNFQGSGRVLSLSIRMHW
jgi:outer membrane receptor protein involved in Fe transport